MTKFSKFFSIFALLALLVSFCAFAETAADITDSVEIVSDKLKVLSLTDNDISTHSGGSDVTISIKSAQPMGGLYIKYYEFPSGGTLNSQIPIAENSFLHEFVPLDSLYQAELFYTDTDICDIQVFSVGNMPKEVQMWQTGQVKTDLLLCATHSDDDQLFFAGLLPYYAGVKKANVRVAYFINHFDTYNRTHEILDGLWECGVKNYPDISPFPDEYSESGEEALRILERRGFTYDDILSFQNSLLEKYKPLVVVLHDFKGEYGHGAHILNTKSFVEACETGSGYVPEKIYVHLYEKNGIVLDIDTPLEEFGGLSAFQVSQKAFGHHKSQHWTWFYEWIYGKNNTKTKSSHIRSYSPIYYGLYYSRVGEDVNKNCMLENVTLYRDRQIVLPAIPESDVDLPSKPLSKLTLPKTAYEGGIDGAVIAAIILVFFSAAFIAVKIYKKKR